VELQQGLEWIRKLCEAPERDARELELVSTLAQVLFVTSGYAPSGAAAERARDLAEKGGNLAQFVVQVFGIWRSVNGAGIYPPPRCWRTGYSTSPSARAAPRALHSRGLLSGT
jgi:hypothetical protein